MIAKTTHNGHITLIMFKTRRIPDTEWLIVQRQTTAMGYSFFVRVLDFVDVFIRRKKFWHIKPKKFVRSK